MSFQPRTCLVAVCNGCDRAYVGYEDEYTIHFDSPDEFNEWQKDAEEDQRWKIEGDNYLGEDLTREETVARMDELLALERVL